MSSWLATPLSYVLTSPTSVPPRDDNHRNASWLLSLQTKFLERASESDGRSRSRAAKEKPSRTAAPLLGAAVTEHGEVIDLVYFRGKSVTEVAEIVGIAEATVKTRMFLRAQEVGGVRCHGLGGYHCVAAPAYRIRGSFLTTADGRRLLNAV